jgi:UDP-glucose 4-epimerase
MPVTDANRGPPTIAADMRVCVTGGAGFIGANLCRALLAAGHETVALDDLSTGSKENLDGVDALLVEGSILDPAALDEAVGGAEAVVHLAARGSVPRSIADPMATNDVNVTGTVQVLEAARRAGGPQVVVASSSSVYGSNPNLPRGEDDTPMPMSPYAVSKLATEQYALAYGASFGLDVLPFRFFNVFGPLQPADHAYAAVVPAFVDAALAGRPLPVQGDGTQTRDFTYVGTVTEVLVDAVARRVTSDAPVNLAFGSRVSLLELIALLEGELGRSLEREHLPPRVGDVRDSQADDARLRALFADVRPVPLEVGLRETIAWFRSR